MGILNVIKLANDYNKAKKYLKQSKVDAKKIKEITEKLQDYVAELNKTRDEITVHILKVKEVMRNLSDRLRPRKEIK